MTTQPESSKQAEIKGSISILLEEASSIYKRIYSSALTFLFLGLGVAAGGVLYFYFSNDALFLDRAFYEERIATLEADKVNFQRGARFMADDFYQRADMDSIRRNTLNKYVDLNVQLIASYKKFYNEVIEADKARNPQKKASLIRNALPYNDSLYKAHFKESMSLQQQIKAINTKHKQFDTIITKFDQDLMHPATPQVRDNDKPELTFTPKLVYGFLSRLGGLIFIELVAFYLLKQYRVNMNDFRYYYGIARQARVNLYLLDSVEKIEDEKARIDIISKLFSPSSDKTDVIDDSPLAASDIDAARKLLESIKDLLKK